MLHRALEEALDAQRGLWLFFAGTANANIHLMKKTILLVDDDVSVREAVEKVLRGAGYEVVLAAGGLEAITRIQAQPIDLVLLDIGLPNQNGWEACRHLSREHANVPIIVITGQTGQFKSALAAGAVGLMEKPLDAHRLLEGIQQLLAAPKPSDPPRASASFYRSGA
jgi:CheY-like chemotaxis protein